LNGSVLAQGFDNVIDAHTHIGATWPNEHVIVSVDECIRMMDRCGIAKAWSSASRILRFDFQEGNRITRKAVEAFPTRIVGFCVADPRRSAESAQEIDRYLGEYGFAGIKIHISHNAVPYDDARYNAIYRKADEYRAPVLAHAFAPEEVRSLLRAASRYPDVPFMVGHSGGITWEETIAEIAAVPNAYFDICASCGDNGRVEAFVAAGGAERVLFGTDLPFLSPAFDLSQVVHAHLAREEKELILGGNAARIIEGRP
jgi:predicted TIM-barrel fold metal-dependent hydrolase